MTYNEVMENSKGILPKKIITNLDKFQYRSKLLYSALNIPSKHPKITKTNPHLLLYAFDDYGRILPRQPAKECWYSHGSGVSAFLLSRSVPHRSLRGCKSEFFTRKYARFLPRGKQKLFFRAKDENRSRCY